MRATCAKCGERFDIPHDTILKEADRVKDKRYGRPVGREPGAPDVDGNALAAIDPSPASIAEWRKAYAALVVDCANKAKELIRLRARIELSESANPIADLKSFR